MRLALALALGTAVLGGCAAARAEEPAASAQETAVQGDLRRLADRIQAIHPQPFHTRNRAAWRADVERLVERAPGLSRDVLLVELMRLAALGPRDGHGGLYPFGEHARPLHLFPLRVWSFPEGFHVIGSLAHPDLVGMRLVAIGGRPAGLVAARVRPLVAADNRWSRELRLPEFMLTVEVLHGLGLLPDTGPARLTFARRDGSTVERTLAPVSQREYVGRVVGTGAELWVPPAPPRVPRPLWLRRHAGTQFLTTLDRGRAVYLAYTHTTEETWDVSERLLRLARRPGVRRVIVDVRLNGGGNNMTYGPLVEALASDAVNRPGKLVLLTSRITFSAAANFVGVVDAATRARLVGEPAGGSPDNYGDREPVELPALGLTVYVAPEWVDVVRGPTPAVTPVDVAVPLTAAAFFAGRDPVLERALR